MANVSRINGFKPVRHRDGSPWNGSLRMYAVPASDGTALFVGDLVKLAADADATTGLPQVVAATAGTPGTGAAAVGVVMGFVPTNTDPNAGTLQTGSLSLDTPQYRVASTLRYVLVCDDPTVIFEVEASTGGAAYSFAATDTGNTCNVFCGAGSTSTGASAHSADLGDKGTTATLPLKVMGAVRRADNDLTGNYTKIHVFINNHQYSGGTGVAGV